jgi:hypothetical protein
MDTPNCSRYLLNQIHLSIILARLDSYFTQSFLISCEFLGMTVMTLDDLLMTFDVPSPSPLLTSKQGCMQG